MNDNKVQIMIYIFIIFILIIVIGGVLYFIITDDTATQLIKCKTSCCPDFCENYFPTTNSTEYAMCVTNCISKCYDIGPYDTCKFK